MIFQTTIDRIPCKCRVWYYQPHQPMVITGSGFGDAVPPEEEEFDFTILDSHGHPAAWLERKLTEQDHSRLMQEFKDVATASHHF